MDNLIISYLLIVLLGVSVLILYYLLQDFKNEVRTGYIHYSAHYEAADSLHRRIDSVNSNLAILQDSLNKLNTMQIIEKGCSYIIKEKEYGMTDKIYIQDVQGKTINYILGKKDYWLSIEDFHSEYTIIEKLK